MHFKHSTMLNRVWGALLCMHTGGPRLTPKLLPFLHIYSAYGLLHFHTLVT